MEFSFECHHDRRTRFASDATAYDEGRPGYPERVFELLRDRCGLRTGSRVLEIGPGTGQATGRMLDLGASVVAIEIGEELASLLRSKHTGRDLHVEVGAFEDVTLRPESFDLVVAATSFHWIPPEIRLQRCADALRPGGSLALWWNVFGDPERRDPFHDALTPILERLAPALLDVPGTGNASTGAPAYATDVRARTAEIETSGLFGPVYHETVTWTGRHQPAELRALFASFSPWLALPIDQRTVVLDELEHLARDRFAGTVERPYLTPIYITTKQPAQPS